MTATTYEEYFQGLMTHMDNAPVGEIAARESAVLTKPALGAFREAARLMHLGLKHQSAGEPFKAYLEATKDTQKELDSYIENMFRALSGPPV